MSSEKLSEASRQRMIRLSIILQERDWGPERIVSAELAELVGTTPESLRKDLSLLGCSASGRGYRAGELADLLSEKLNLKGELKAGVCGLDSWGAVLLHKTDSFPGVRIVAAFDGSQNRLERTESKVPLYPSYEISEIFQRMGIEIGIIASSTTDPERIQSRMLKGGARGIINLTSCPLTVPESVFYHQADLTAGFLSVISRINGVKQ
ncbi:MAG: winged-helix domain-containing protein [Spirochaetales bacterium]|nr:winged-helix domain-containing protein [Spirochaetales bacterium]